jgi:signal transduction histidine kinase
MSDALKGRRRAGTVSPRPGSAAEPLHSFRQDAVHGSQDDEVLCHLGSLLDSVTTGIVSLDGESRIRVFNAAVEGIFGLSRQAVLGRPFSMIGSMFGADEYSLRTLWERLSDAVWAAGAALDLEYVLIRPKALKKIITYSVYPLGRSAWSLGNGVVIMLEDITRKKEMEEQISDARKRLQAVFDGITDGIQVVDSEFRVTAVNKSMMSLVGGPVIIGQRCYSGCGFQSGVCDDCPAVETLRSGQPAFVVKRISLARRGGQDRSDRILEISTFPLLDRGNRAVQVVEYIKDVTEKVRLAERLEHARRLAEVGETAARIAHEVRNPLNAITGAAHYLATEYPQDDVIQKFTSLIKRQSLRVDQVASDILHAAKPMRLNRTGVNLHAVLDQALGSLRQIIKQQGISLEKHYDQELPAVQADELQVEQALYNVLKNAVEAMSCGGILAVRTARGDADGWVRIVVQDTGCGIAPRDRERIFHAFFTTKPQGTGLGLSIVEGVLKNHGGEIGVEQPAEGGPRVVIRLPINGAGPGTGRTTMRAS